MMYRLLKIESSRPQVTTEHLLGDEAAARWLEIAESVYNKNCLEGLTFALALGNRLYLIVEGEEDLNPAKFIIRGEVSRRYDVLPSIKVTKFSKPVPLLDTLLAESSLGLDIAQQLSQQHPEFVDWNHISLTGVSIDFLEDTRRYRWNGTSHTTALSPLARYLPAPEDFSMEDLCDY